MAARGLRSFGELAAGKPCGTRVGYFAGCRCDACRAANTEYERQRRAARGSGGWNGMVDADRARAHIRRLQRQGIGFKHIADSAKVPPSTVGKILYGGRDKVRALTERRILAVTAKCAADRALVSARRSWALIQELVQCGDSKARIASEIIGHPVRALQLERDRITVRNAHRVRLAWERLRYADAAATARALRMLDELREEGFLPSRVLAELAAEALRLSAPAPDTSLRDGRMKASTVRLVEAVHRHLLKDD